MKFLSRSRAQTGKIAGILAKEALRKPLKIKTALIFALTGELGSGKTTFVQSFIKAAGIKHRITSPTFLLVKGYRLKVKGFRKIYHIDCYRIKKPKELLNLGLKEILSDPEKIVLIEWAEKLKKIFPKDTIWIKFSHSKKENERIIKITK